MSNIQKDKMNELRELVKGNPTLVSVIERKIAVLEKENFLNGR